MSALIVFGILLSGQAAVAAPQYNMEERAFAVAGPSLVYLEMHSKGFLRRKDNGELVNQSAISFIFRCSGFVITAAGQVISSSRCVSPDQDSLRSNAIIQLAGDRVRTGAITAADRDPLIKDLQATADFTGDKPGSKPDVKVYGQLYQGQASLTTDPAVGVEVVKSDPPNETDVALLKLPQGGLPMAELSQTAINIGTPVVIIGFGTETGSSTYVARYKPVRIIGRSGTKTPATYQIDSDLGGASQGGLVVDSVGRVVGMIDTDLAGTNRPNKLIVNNAHLSTILAGASASNSLSSMDSAYRNGLNAYFGGRYSDAIEEFDRVLALVPDHGLAKAYRTQAADRLAIEGDSSSLSLPVWVIIVLGVLILALLLSLAMVVWLLGRLRARPPYMSSPISALPVSAYPVSPIHASQPPYDYQRALSSEPTGPPPMITGWEPPNYDDDTRRRPDA